MKIRKNHLYAIQTAIEAVKPQILQAIPSYKEAGFSMTRLMWDAFRLANVGGNGTDRWICDELYPYMDDTHLDTALKRVFANLGISY